MHHRQWPFAQLVSGRESNLAMNSAELKPRIATVVDAQSGAHLAAIAAISSEEFAWTQIAIPDLARYESYEDWSDSREGFKIGLAMSGVEAVEVPVASLTFFVWCRLTQTPPTERALDAFALVLLALRKSPPAKAFAKIDENDFGKLAGSVDAFTPYASFEQWKQRREERSRTMIAAGARIEPLPVHLDHFVEWSRCVGENTSEKTLDAYAQLVLEFLLQDAPV